MEERFIEPQKPKSRNLVGTIAAVIVALVIVLLYNQYGKPFSPNDDKQVSKVTLTDDYLKSICPFRMVGLGVVQNVSTDEGAIAFHFFITESDDSNSIDVTTIKRNEERAIDLAMVEVQGTKGELRELMHHIAQNGLSLCFDIKGDNGGNGQITLNSQKIKEALRRLPFTNDYEFSLNAIACTNRMLLPLKVDSVTEWIDVELNVNDFIYVYNVDDRQQKVESIDLVAQKEFMYKKLKENKKDMRNIIEGCAQTKRGIIYRYISKWTKESTGIHIWSEELEYMGDEAENEME